MLKYSHCKMHDTYPQDDEPCWACIRQFSGSLCPINSAAVENQENRRPCRIDNETLCVQHSDEDECNCDPCEEYPVAIAYKESN